MVAEALVLAGAAGAGLAALQLVALVAAWVPQRLSRPSPRSRPWRRDKAVAETRDLLAGIWRRMEDTVREAGRPLGWSAGRWLGSAAAGGALVCVQLGWQFGWWWAWPWCATGATVLVAWLLHREAQENRRCRQAEMVRLLEGLQVLLHSGRDLYSSLRHLTPLADRLRPAWENMLNRWAQHPARALEEFRAEAHLDEADMLTAVLQHALSAGEVHAQSYLAQEAGKLAEMQRERVEELLRTRPELMRWALFLPLVAVLILFLFPGLYRLAEQISNL